MLVLLREIDRSRTNQGPLYLDEPEMDEQTFPQINEVPRGAIADRSETTTNVGTN